MSEALEALGRKTVGVSLDKPNKLFNVRRAYSSVRNKLKKPIWVDHPTNIQLEIHNYCNLWINGKGCIHCNVKPSGGWNLPRGRMSDETIRYVVEYWGKHGALDVAPYINTEWLMDDRCLWIAKLCQENGLGVVVDTNGTLYDSRFKLVHPNIKQVRFSYSALSPETYELVHGANLYREATKTIEWFLKYRENSQYPMIYFITNRYNVGELKPFIKKWVGRCHITVYPLHEVDGIQTVSEQTKISKRNYWDEVTKTLTGKYPMQPFRPVDFYPDGKVRIRHFQPWIACQGSTSFSVNWQGLILHCTDIPYSFNYGSVYDNDMLTVWRERNRAKLGHSACGKCNVKSPRHDKLIKKYCGD
jgi:MoaA/NifB/PqqE/SkfB family radical SAM enzyme